MVRVEPGVRHQLRYAEGQLTDQGAMPSSGRASAPAPVVAAAPSAVVLAPPPPAEPAPVDDAQVTVGPDGARATVRTSVGAVDVKLPRLLGGGR